MIRETEQQMTSVHSVFSSVVVKNRSTFTPNKKPFNLVKSVYDSNPQVLHLPYLELMLHLVSYGGLVPIFTIDNDAYDCLGRQKIKDLPSECDYESKNISGIKNQQRILVGCDHFRTLQSVSICSSSLLMGNLFIALWSTHDQRPSGPLPSDETVANCWVKASKQNDIYGIALLVIEPASRIIFCRSNMERDVENLIGTLYSVKQPQNYTLKSEISNQLTRNIRVVGG
ncbi:hypothetical protein RF11_13606 [Thelohanellus kitauei]|uniref:Uncharacterized protein n=1 Tax=Thelohanellus kitauei TaxID=669202 RepID=A0A0C2MXL1_THEKT|nr:hypothetical protein RF11_13606 [Thelohanellus kitauei]